MAWSIEEVQGKRKHFPENKRENEGIVTFTSKTRVGLYEEIDRFIEEKKPKYLAAQTKRLVPWYRPDGAPNPSKKAERRWELQMYAIRYVKD